MPDKPSPEVLATQRTVWFVGTLLATVVVAALALFGPGTRSACLVLASTGVSCPGCGMTRAVAALLQGDLGAAWRFHPLAPFVALEALVVWGWWGWTALVRRIRINEEIVLWLLVGNSALLVAVWVVRLVSGSLPD